MRSFTSSVEQLLSISSSNQTGEKLYDSVDSFVIPLYQREYKWKSEKIETLIKDIISRDKFLGIVILDYVDNKYEIIDGQQRLTTIFLALAALHNLYQGQKMEQNDILSLLQKNNHYILKNDSIGEYLCEGRGTLSICIKDELDVYYQKKDFERAYSVIYSILHEQLTNGQEQLREFKRKLLDCSFVILINDTHANSQPVEQTFLDINEKSHLLDVEDIFKGHCFQNYSDRNANMLRNQWIKLKKCSAEFSKMCFENLSQYIYLFLLITDSSKVHENLYNNGRHYLQGKSMDETNDILERMILFGEANSKLFDNVKNIHYAFEDICPDSSKYKNTGEYNSLKILVYDFLSQSTLYQKLPLYYLVLRLTEVSSFREALSYNDFKRIIVNFYISGMIFVFSSGRKGKSDIDYSVRDELKIDAPISNDVVKASHALRKERVDQFEINARKHTKEYVRFVYSIIDKFCERSQFLTADYHSQTYTLEHFIMPDHKRHEIQWIDKDGKAADSIKVGATLGKLYKSYLSNYLLLEENLNSELHNYDIIYKVCFIKEWFAEKKEPIPTHVQILLNNIEGKEPFKELKQLKNDKGASVQDIEIAYERFLAQYFGEENQSALMQEITKAFKNAFSSK